MPPFSQGLEHRAEINILSNKAKEVPGLKLRQKAIYTVGFYFVKFGTNEAPEISIFVDSTNLRVAPGYFQFENPRFTK